ncbi:DUF2948 family protein [Rhizobium sp. KVB221]|uniref:DUF2948 family protein n=1 Tax=Rhizobium setariae TaxID=2801340 RepID=A0A937CM54_9HYPH|nr:DUF2948 family protein [Rhizobium setariae]MBL0372381.1 DUF2948 family protein [Rhizobium setariae]
MTMKLLALDDEDLTVISAHMQDAVFRIADVDYTPKQKHFTLAANRFDWEETDRNAKGFERSRSALCFKQVKGVRSIGVDRKAPEKVLSLLAVLYERDGEGPEGSIELVLAGGGSILLDVDCIEVQLADTGGTWETTMKPRHPGAA